ncbi:cytochrome P450 [Cyathus striatus]|nr:cytochrome P450 [Cyathus striatus]
MGSKKAQLDIPNLTLGSFLFVASIIAFHHAFPNLRSFSTTDSFLLTANTIISGSLFILSCITFQRSITRRAELEPPIVHSYLPWIGSTIAYLRSPSKFLKASSAKYGPAFRFQVAGRWITALSSPSAISALLRDRSGAFDVFQMIPVIAGLKSEKIRIAYVCSVVIEKAIPILYRGLSQRNLPNIARDINAGIVHHLGLVMQGRDRIEEISSQSFVLQILYSAVSQAMLGPGFPTRNFSEFQLFNNGIPYIMQERPYFARGAVRAREYLVKDWEHYISENWREDDSGGYLDGATGFVSDIVCALRVSQLTNEEAARLMTALFFGVHSNPIHAATWAIYHLLLDKSTMDIVRQELRDVVGDQYNNDLNTLLQLDPSCLDYKFPIVTSLVKEVLRSKMLPSSARNVVRDATLYTDDSVIFIPKGDVVLADITSLHHNPELHESPEVFRTKRFAGKDAKGRSKTVDFFGGGKHICAGRFHAMNSTRMFIILCLHLYDIELAPSSPTAFPEVEQLFGFTTLVRATTDLKISIQPRKII